MDFKQEDQRLPELAYSAECIWALGVHIKPCSGRNQTAELHPSATLKIKLISITNKYSWNIWCDWFCEKNAEDTANEESWMSEQDNWGGFL